MKAANGKRAVSSVIIIIVIIVVVGAGAGAYYFSTNMGQSPGQVGSSSSSSSQASSSTLTGSSTKSTGTTSQTGSLTQSSTSTQTQAYTGTCFQTSYTGTSPFAYNSSIKAVLVLIKAVPSMTIMYNGTSSSGSGTASTYGYVNTYKVLSQSTSGGVTTYKVQVNSTYNVSSQTSAIAWVRSDGTVTQITTFTGKYNFTFTGSQAVSFFVSFMTPFTIEQSFVAQIQFYTSTLFTSKGQASVTLGPTTMTVNTYEATNLNYNYCGISTTVTDFKMQVGTIPSTSITLVTLLHFQGTTGGQSQEYTIQVTSIG